MSRLCVPSDRFINGPFVCWDLRPRKDTDIPEIVVLHFNGAVDQPGQSCLFVGALLTGAVPTRAQGQADAVLDIVHIRGIRYTWDQQDDVTSNEFPASSGV